MKRHLKSWSPTALMLVVGLAVGFVLRDHGSAKIRSQAPAAAVEEIEAVFKREVGFTRRTKIRERTKDETLTFSPLQWRTLQRERYKLVIDIGDCLQWKHTVQTLIPNDEGWGSDGYSVAREDGGPDLAPIARFLALDGPHTEKLRETLKRFGTRLRGLEQRSVVPQYVGDGTLRLGFGDETAERRTIFNDLDADLLAALGPRDGPRFTVVAAISPDEGPRDQLVLQAAFTGDYLRYGLPNYSESLVERAYANSLSDHVSDSLNRRIGHLNLQIDWKRLIREAGTQPEKPW